MRAAAVKSLTTALLLAMAAVALTAPAAGDTVTRAADRLVAQQAANGSWVGEAGYTGSIVAGLVNAYDITGNLSYKTAAEAGGTWILNNSAPNLYGDEAYALTGLSSLAANPANNAWRTAVTDFYTAVKDGEGGTSGYIGGFSSIDPSTATFYLANHTVAAFYVDATDRMVWRSGLIDYLADVTDSAYYPVMALGVAVWGLAQTGPMDAAPVAPSAAPGSTWYGKTLADLPGVLAGHQVADGDYAGSFYYRFDHTGPGGTAPSGFTEDAVFGTLGLMAADDADPGLSYDDEILAARTVLAAGVATIGSVYEHIWSGGATYHAYAGETLQALPGPAGLNEWALTGGGSYNVLADWRANAVPDAAGAAANFLGNITAPALVTVDAAVTVGAITFASEQGYTVAGPAAITLEDPDGEARIALQRGSHAISAPLVLGSALDMATPPGTALAILGPLDNSTGETLTKIGGGTVTISGPQTHGSGAALLVEAGTLNLLSDAGSAAEANLTVEVTGGIVNLACTQHLGALVIGDGGKVVLTPGPKVLVVNSLWIDTGGGPSALAAGGAEPVPEPATLALLTSGVVLSVLLRRYWRRQPGGRTPRTGQDPAQRPDVQLR